MLKEFKKLMAVVFLRAALNCTPGGQFKKDLAKFITENITNL